MGRRESLPPPVRCRATSKQAGRQCKLWAVPGTLVCPKHGGAAGQVKRKADVERTLAVMLDMQPGRPLRAVLADAVKICDAAMVDAAQEIRKAKRPTPAQVERLVVSAGRAAAMVRQAIDTGVTDDNVSAQPAADATVVTAVDRVVSALATVWPGDTTELRAWSRSALSAALQDHELPAPPRYVQPAAGWRMPVAALETAEVVTARNGTAEDQIVDVETWLAHNGVKAAVSVPDGSGVSGDQDARGNGSTGRTEPQSNGSAAVDHTAPNTGRNAWRTTTAPWSDSIDDRRQQ